MLARSLLVLALLSLGACTTTVDQSVVRYRLDLASNRAAAGLRCWDACQSESHPTYRSWCIAKCPGVERSVGEACQVDARVQPTEMCMTYVRQHRYNENGRAAVAVAGQIVVEGAKAGATAAFEGGAHAAAHSITHSDDSTSSSTFSPAQPPSRTPANPSIAPRRPEHRPAEPVIR